jgi:hypothetical protein
MSDEIIVSENKSNVIKLRENPWIVVSLVLGVLLIVSVFQGGITGNATKGDVEQNLESFLKSQIDGEYEIKSITKEDSYYSVVLIIQEQEIPIEITLDGKYLISSLVPLNEIESSEPVQKEVPKTDKPKVELFIWSYCPYGVQAQGPLASVASLLKDKVDFEAVLYYDGHGDYETSQNKIQACIQEIDKNKYWNYASGFVEKIYPKCGSSRDINCDKQESISLMKSLGIDSNAVMSCVDTKGESLIAEHSNRAKVYGVTGSPSLVINGVVVQVNRDAESYKNAVCDAFNSSPEECNTKLQSTTATTSGNC